jgi:hypothetical protein
LSSSGSHPSSSKQSVIEEKIIDETCACKKCSKLIKMSQAIKINDYLFCDTCHKELIEMSKQKTLMLQQQKDAEKYAKS